MNSIKISFVSGNFINYAMPVVKSALFIETGSAHTTILYGRPKEFWEKFVHQLNTNRTINAELNWTKLFWCSQLRLEVRTIT